MEKILNLKKSILAIIMVAVAMVFNSCATGGSTDYDYPLDAPATTGLCGTKWVLVSATGQTELDYASYIFNLDGTGVHEYTKENKSIATSTFTWKSYNIGTSSMHMLVIVIDKTEMMTYYSVSGEVLRLNNGSGAIFTYYPEEAIGSQE